MYAMPLRGEGDLGERPARVAQPRIAIASASSAIRSARRAAPRASDGERPALLHERARDAPRLARVEREHREAALEDDGDEGIDRAEPARDGPEHLDASQHGGRDVGLATLAVARAAHAEPSADQRDLPQSRRRPRPVEARALDDLDEHGVPLVHAAAADELLGGSAAERRNLVRRRRARERAVDLRGLGAAAAVRERAGEPRLKGDRGRLSRRSARARWRRGRARAACSNASASPARRAAATR